MRAEGREERKGKGREGMGGRRRRGWMPLFSNS